MKQAEHLLLRRVILVVMLGALTVAAVAVLVLVALAATGALSAYIGQSHPLRPTIRVVIGGALALAATFIIGRLLNTSGIV